MQHSSQQQPPLLVGAEMAIPQGWRSLAVAMANELASLGLPPEYRIEKVFRVDQYMHVFTNSECLRNADKELHDSVYTVICNYSHMASQSCMTCGQHGNAVFVTDQWSVYCDSHLPPDAQDLHAEFADIPLESLDRKGLRAQFPMLPGLELRAGWLPLIKRLMQKLTAVGFSEAHYKIVQVKEKFASLAFYIYSTDPDSKRQQLIHALIDAAQNRSTSMCEICGHPAKLWIHAGWWTTVCNEHVPDGAKTPADYFQKSTL